MPTIPEKIAGRISTMYVREDGILQIDLSDNELFSLEDAFEIIKNAEVLGGGKKFLNLIVAGKGTMVDEAARKYSSSVEGCKYKLADAFVLNSLAQKLIGNFIIKINKPAVPTAIFTDIEEAVKWLKSLEV